MAKKKKNSNYQTAQKNTAPAQKPKKKMIDGWMFIGGFLLGGGAILIDRFIYDLPDFVEVVCLGLAALLLLAYMSNARIGAQKK